MRLVPKILAGVFSFAKGRDVLHARIIDGERYEERRPPGGIKVELKKQRVHRIDGHAPGLPPTAPKLLQTDSNVTARLLEDSNQIQDSDLILTDYYNNQYVGTIYLGSPLQALSAVYDTGSSDLWIPGRGCKECGHHTTFDSSASSTYASVNDKTGSPVNFEVDYGSGKVTGYEAAETVGIGPLLLSGVSFGEVTYEDAEIQSFMMDGIVGLAFRGLSMVTKPTILDLLNEQHPDVPYMFSMFLSNDPDDEKHPSHLVFGSYDLNIVGPNATWHYTPVIKRGYGDFKYWTVKMSSMTVESRRNDKWDLCKSTCYAIVDSGTSGIAVPEDSYDDLISYVTDGLHCKGITCYYASVSDFPDLVFFLSPDNEFPLLANDYVSCSHWGECVIKFQVSSGSSYWILGDVFIEAYYTLFDVENMRIGFACDGECGGGNWHGQGGFIEVDGPPYWEQLVLLTASVCVVCATFYGMFTFFTGLYVRYQSKCVEAHKEDAGLYHPYRKICDSNGDYNAVDSVEFSVGLTGAERSLIGEVGKPSIMAGGRQLQITTAKAVDHTSGPGGKGGNIYCEDSMVDAEWDEDFWDDGLGEGRGNYEDVGLRDVGKLAKNNANEMDHDGEAL